jgi:hypothetical protein
VLDHLQKCSSSSSLFEKWVLLLRSALALQLPTAVPLATA